jgi:hypothetical protein
MEQIKAFIEKAKSDSELMAKQPQKEVLQMDENKKLGEEQLREVSGGATQNRHDPKSCVNLTRTKYECVGLLAICWCDHYRRTDTGAKKGRVFLYRHDCAMGAFSYEGDVNGTPTDQIQV